MDDYTNILYSMFGGIRMLTQGTSITVTYKQVEGIKIAYYNNKELLKDYFNEATVLPIPDDAPLEIPRIIIKTKNEHAQLNISPIATTFEIRYDSGFERNWQECSAYITDRMSKVFKFLNILTDNKYEYIGLVSNVIYDEIEQEGAKKIAKNLLNATQISNLYDINIKYTFVENQKLFINIMLQNARLFKKGVSVNEAGALSVQDQVAESIGAIIDINDRYGFNTDPSYISDSSMLNTLIESMGIIIKNKLATLIEKGEY